ncbi:fluoride efflux transporter family protein [Corynebacterium cystitidis]|uniref:fluoride efflux transporter family protein n=1 Tax=Corynebacterium cystitidis TaxID=35757 RepID=UPI00211E6503|nr:fluoride efflux transporter family protein [Corynebacterium cystitidis]
MIKEGLLVGVGAALGALARFGLSSALNDDIPTVLLINIVGCFLMGLCNPGKFWGTGFLGGFTTFSAFALTTATSSASIALGLAVVTLLACVGAWLAGDWWRRSA